MGQLGVGHPSTTEFALEPMKLPLPEGMLLHCVAAGGRHSAGITRCGKLLTWGWGEEGQLGLGNEKNNFLPRPCRLPRVKGKMGTPSLVSLGMCHTVVLLQNDSYTEPIAAPPKQPSPVNKEVVAPPPPSPEPAVEETVPLVECDEPSPPSPLPPVLVEEEETAPVPEQEQEPEPAPVTPIVIRSIKELLQRREERQPNLLEEVPVVLEKEEEKAEIVPAVAEIVSPSPPPFTIVEELPPQDPVVPTTKEPVLTTSASESKFLIYYKDGMATDNCLVANSAKRAEMRRLKKEKEQQLEKEQKQLPTRKKSI